MPRQTLPASFVLLATLLGLCAPSAFAQSIPITNFDFETNGVGDTAFTNNPGVIPTGWTAVGAIASGQFYGYFNPVSGDYPGTTGGGGTNGTMSGENIFYFGSAVTGDGIQQTLSTNFFANTNYTLTVAVGTRATQLANTAHLNIELLVGSTVLATATVRNTSAGTFVDFSATYSYISGDAGLVGQALKIRLTENNTTFSGEVDIDNIRLTATAVPEPATSAAVVGLLAFTGVFVRRRLRGRQPAVRSSIYRAVGP